MQPGQHTALAARLEHATPLVLQGLAGLEAQSRRWGIRHPSPGQTSRKELGCSPLIGNNPE